MIWRFACYLLLVAMLAACGRAEDALDTYADRLLRTLDASAGTGEPVPAARMPRPGALQVPLDRLSINPLEFLELGDCALEITVARSNSSLGKLSSPSQRLLLELEFLALAPDCIAALREEDEDALADELQAALALKRQQLPARIFNATLGSPEFYSMWQPVAPAADYPATTSSATITALEALAGAAHRWQSGAYDTGIAELEGWLKIVTTADAGQLQQALLVQQARIDVLTDVVAGQSLCYQGRPTPTSRTLLNVVTLFFAGEVQPRAAALEQRRYQLLAPVRQLEDLLVGTLPPDYIAWQQLRDQQLIEAAGAPRRHAQALQRVLADCGLRPGDTAAP